MAPHDDIANTARRILSELHEFQSEKIGARPSLHEFFPINLRQVIEDLFGWQLEERTMIGFLPSGHPIIGQTNYDEKTLLIDIGETSESEQNFTLAHEIGHITLHRTSYACDGFATRAHSSRRNDRLVNPDPLRSQLEREAEIFAAELLMPRKSVSNYFKLLFERDRLWADGRVVKDILQDSGTRLKQPSLKAIAKAVAGTGNGDKTLSEFFGVSLDAMALRLVRLGLVY